MDQETKQRFDWIVEKNRLIAQCIGAIRLLEDMRENIDKLQHFIADRIDDINRIAAQYEEERR